VFLVALTTVLEFWNIVGGSYHLELMYWMWKFGISLAMAGMITALASVLAVRGKLDFAAFWRLIIFMALTMALAGGVTYYYHLNEPTDDEQSDEPSITKTEFRIRERAGDPAPGHIVSHEIAVTSRLS
jgi:hypothetical protein